MSVADQINRIKTNIANTYTAAQAKGATMPQTQNSDNLAACVQSITTGGGGGTQFGLTAEQMLGTLDGEGNLTYPLLPSITFAGLKSLPNNGYYSKFVDRVFETGATVSFPDLVSVDTGTFQNCFQNTSGLETVIFSSLENILEFAMTNVFRASLSLKNAEFPALKMIASMGWDSAFYGTKIQNISFPALTNVQNGALGTASYNYCFADCTALTEIHFRADMQATIEAMTGYADKFGAVNASLIFDL